jgi:hypothetical protein
MHHTPSPSHNYHLPLHLQESAVQSTRQLLQQQLPAEASPQLHLLQGCHSQLQALVGSNLAKLVAFNLGYLPGGDKGIITSASSTVAAVEAALEVRLPLLNRASRALHCTAVCPG